jgi:hypothetical protein
MYYALNLIVEFVMLYGTVFQIPSANASHAAVGLF